MGWRLISGLGSEADTAPRHHPVRTDPQRTARVRPGWVADVLQGQNARCYPCAARDTVAELHEEAGALQIGDNSFSLVDLLIILYFMGFFVLGFAQGTIRRLIGIGSILFSWFLAAQLAAPLSDFLGANWTQFSKEYSYMIGFATIFVASAIAFALVAQGFYKPQPLFQKARFADEIIGGLLGLLEAAIIYGAVLIILDSFFQIPGIPQDPQELPYLRDIWNGMDGSQFTDFFRQTLIPAFFVLTGLFVPDEIEARY
jgi:membrane protein required for colicin V production